MRARFDLSSSDEPSHASRPRSRTNTRPAKSKARSICCSTRTTVTEPDAAKREINTISSFTSFLNSKVRN